MFPTDRLFKRIVAAMTLIAVLCFVAFGVSYCHQRNVTQRAQIGERMARGESNAANAATGAVIDYAERQADRDATTRNNRDAIQAAPNSNDPAGAAGDAGIRGLCERASFRNDPVCLRLKDTASVSR